MKKIWARFLAWQRELRDLCKLAGLSDAIKYLLFCGDNGVVSLKVRMINRGILIRRGTSDLSCLKKVFSEKEYLSPFPLSPKLIIDGGANIGMATLFFAYVYPDAKIIALEPERTNFEILKKNCHGLTNVTLVNAALWSSEQNLKISDPSADKWGFQVEERKEEQGSGDNIRAITVNSLLEMAGAKKIDLLKLDIEGAERELFGNSSDGWLDCVGAIAVELHDRYRMGCSQAFYSAMVKRPFRQEVRGENIFIQFHATSDITSCD